MLQIFTAFFILYEIAKMLHSKSFINLLTQMKSLEGKKDIVPKDVFRVKYVAVFFVEMAYVVYTAVLLFTGYWYVGVLLIVLALIYKKRLNSKTMISDGIISILVLSMIFVL